MNVSSPVDFNLIYTAFNYAEGLIWLAFAVCLPLLFRKTATNQKWGIVIACLGFVLFGISDLIEASIRSDIPVSLLSFKIACGTMILSGRFTYVGWKRFNLRDRYFLFGLFCLIAVSGIIAYRIFSGPIDD